jgi:hypothetical protein
MRGDLNWFMQKHWEARRLQETDRAFREKKLTKIQKHILSLLRSGCYISEDHYVMDRTRRVAHIENIRTIYRLLEDKFIRWDKARKVWVYIP